MAEVIGVRFKDVSKIYYYTTNGQEYQIDDQVIVETIRGVECGWVVILDKELPKKQMQDLKPVIRAVTNADLKVLEKQNVQEAMEICQKKIDKHKLKMKLVDAEYIFDNSKILFYFTAEGRVDFRELVKDLASVFRTRIELRQIGVRDESKLLGGLGVCGRPFCCSTFLNEFQHVSIKMAKEQSLSLNPTKISGTCGRLMCCLKYEQDVYSELLRITPKTGAIVKTEDGKGVVTDMNLLTGKLTVRLDSKPDIPKIYNKKEVKLIKDGQVKLDKKELASLKNLEDK